MIIKEPENIIYHEETHSYTRKSDGKLLAGVSSVADFASNSSKVNALMGWAVREAIGYVRENAPLIKSNEDFEKVLEEARTAHTKKSEEAKSTGTDVHAVLEKIIKGKDITEEEKSLRAVEQFNDWVLKNEVKWIASEILVGDAEKYECAGRLDALALVGDKIILVDFKVANALYPSYYLQTAGYGLLLEQMGIQIGGRIIMRLPKTEKRKVFGRI